MITALLLILGGSALGSALGVLLFRLVADRPLRWYWLDGVAQALLPDLAWYIYRWATNHRRMRTRYPSPRKAIDYQRRLSAAMRKGW